MKHPFHIFPAIDLLDGQSVRLQRGARESASIVHPDPLVQLQEYKRLGAVWVHIVDLNAAFGDDANSAGRRANAQMVETLVRQAGLQIQLGGGLRDEPSCLTWLGKGVTRVVVGTWCARDPDAVARLAAKTPDAVVAALDSHGTQVATHGWTHATTVSVFDLARRLAQGGLRRCLYTQVERDGMLTGVDAELAGHLHAQSGLFVLASGGVRDEGDIQRLSRTVGVEGVIVGKALAAKTLLLGDALSHERQTMAEF